MTVLSGAYITSIPSLPLFGGAQGDVLECLNCPIVKDVLTVEAYRALRNCGTTLVPTAGRLLVE
jgi:hypothetical protein